MKRPRRGQLTQEDRRLWAEVARSVQPLDGRPSVQPPEEPATPVPASPPPRPSASCVPPPRPKAAKGETSTLKAPAPNPPSQPPLAALERRTKRALARGRTQAEASLDLHGLTQTQAHARLIGFLRRSQASGQGLVLVITGRGAPSGSGDPMGLGERGVLRRMVPLWLRVPELRGLVLGFEEAGTRQGGAGALYIRLRRAR